MLYFLREDYEGLLRRIKHLEDEYRKVSSTSGDVKSGDQSEGFGLEGVERQQVVLTGLLHDLLAIRSEARVIEPTESNKHVCIGKKVTIRDLDTEKERTLIVGSYRNYRNNDELSSRDVPADRDSGDKVDILSYDGPLGKIIRGAKVGEIREGIIKEGEGTRTFEIISIE